MATRATAHAIAHLVDQDGAELLEVLGPTVAFLTAPEGGDDAPCVMRGTIPPGVVVPLHAHADPETFLVLGGELEGLVVSPEGAAWVPVRLGDVFHVPGGAKHAWRNLGREPAVTLIVSTNRLGRFLRELGVPVGPGGTTAWPPSGGAIRRFLETAERYGYWNAGAEENAEVGIRLG
jgi:quercetin dioxygenase-like cupin family protein